MPSFRWAYGSTGGNGVHFGILHDPTAGGTAPIVMTVPMASDTLTTLSVPACGSSLHWVAAPVTTAWSSLPISGGRQEEIAWLERGQWPMGMAGWDGPGQGIDPVELLEAWAKSSLWRLGRRWSSVSASCRPATFPRRIRPSHDVPRRGVRAGRLL